MAFWNLRLVAFLWLGLIFIILMIYQFLYIGQLSSKSACPPAMSFEAKSSPPVPVVLQDLLEWPSLPGDAVAFSSSTSPEKSHLQLLHPQEKYRVGDTLLVWLEAQDQSGRPKRYGGDYFRAKVYSQELKASTVGTVNDHHNGTYTLTFPLLWAGAVQVSVRLIHSSEAVATLRHIRHSQPSTVTFFGFFVDPGKPSSEEATECNVHPSPGPSCQYTDPGTGEHWFCAKPRRYQCSALVYHSMGRYKDVLPPNKKVFFGGAVTDKAVPGRLPIIQVLPGPQLAVATSPSHLCRPGLTPASPPGFYYKDMWVSLECSSRTFPTPKSALSCLRGKIIHMLGDSTLRQWWEFLVDFIPSLKRIDLHVPYNAGPLLAVEPGHGLVLQWRAHGLPLRCAKTKKADIHYIANVLDALGAGPDTVVVFTIWAHFTSFPVKVYVRRVQRIRQAVEQLLARSPLTTIIIKTANTGYKTVYGSDWLSMQLDRILRAVFAGIPVAIVDAWAMTSCHYLPDNIHPGKVIVRDEVNAFLSYVCPGK